MSENEVSQTQVSFATNEQLPQTIAEILDPNPLNLSLPALERDKIFDVRYRGNGALTVVTTAVVPNMVYIYDGKEQVARVSLTEDRTRIQDFQLAITPNKAAAILEQNPTIPYREQIQKALNLSRESTEISRVSFEFGPPPEAIQEAESLFKDTFTERILSVPPGLIRSLLKDVPDDIPGLHIPKLIGDQPNPMLEEYHSRALGWVLGNGLDVDKALSLARRIVYHDSLMISSNINEDYAEKKRLAFHESLHIFISLLRQSPNKEVQDIARKMMGAYINIEPSKREQSDFLLTRFGYTSLQRPEEFWTYYLADRAYPVTTGKNPVEAITQLSSHTNIQRITDRLPFLVDTEDIHQFVDDALENAEQVRIKGSE